LQSSIHLNNGFGETEASDDSELNIEAIPLARAAGSHGGLHRLVLRLVYLIILSLLYLLLRTPIGMLNVDDKTDLLVDASRGSFVFS
jgi:hypothetical protein